MMSFGYKKLKDAVDADCKKDGGSVHIDGCCNCGAKCFHKYCDKFKWVVDRAREYGKVLGVSWEDILKSWENDRSYWYMNYYQDCNQPKLDGKNVRVFDTLDDFKKSAKEPAFRCPSCGRVTNSPSECYHCGWKVYGFLGSCGKGVFIYIKEKLMGQEIFMPVAWEKEK